MTTQLSEPGTVLLLGLGLLALGLALFYSEIRTRRLLDRIDPNLVQGRHVWQPAPLTSFVIGALVGFVMGACLCEFFMKGGIR